MTQLKKVCRMVALGASFTNFFSFTSESGIQTRDFTIICEVNKLALNH